MGIKVSGDMKLTTSGETSKLADRMMEKMGASWPAGTRSQSHQVRVETVTTTKPKSRVPFLLCVLVGLGALLAWLMFYKGLLPPPP